MNKNHISIKKPIVPDYARGYKDGYHDGKKEGTGDSEKVLANDLVYIYGALCLHLKDKYGWSKLSIENLVLELQDKWVEAYKYESEERMHGRKPVSIPQKVKTELNIDLVQSFGIKDWSEE